MEISASHQKGVSEHQRSAKKITPKPRNGSVPSSTTAAHIPSHLVTAENVDRYERVCREMQRIVTASTHQDPVRSCTTVVLPHEFVTDDIHAVVVNTMARRGLSTADQLSVIVTTGSDNNSSSDNSVDSCTKDSNVASLSAAASSNNAPPRTNESESDAATTNKNNNNVIIVYRSPVTVSLDKYAHRAVAMRECSLQLWSLYNALCVKAIKRASMRSSRRRCATPTSRIKSMNNFIKTVLLGKYHQSKLQEHRDKLSSSSSISSATTKKSSPSTSSSSSALLRVMDLGCGRGQDVYKFGRIRPSSVMFVDLADQCLRMAERRWRRNATTYHASFIQADFTVPHFLDRANIMFYKHVLAQQPQYHTPTATQHRRDGAPTVSCTPGRSSHHQHHRQQLQQQDSVGITAAAQLTVPGSGAAGHADMFDIVSCQFAAQYAADSVDTLNVFVDNVSRYLAPGGIFLGIIPDGERITHLLSKTGGIWNGAHCTIALQRPEDAVHLVGTASPPRTGLCYKFSMDDTIRCYEYTIRFEDFVEAAKRSGMRLVHSDNAAQYARREMADPINRDVLSRMGLARNLLSREEWETVGMYRVFAFVKAPPPSYDDNNESKK